MSFPSEQYQNYDQATFVVRPRPILKLFKWLLLVIYGDNKGHEMRRGMYPIQRKIWKIRGQTLLVYSGNFVSGCVLNSHIEAVLQYVNLRPQPQEVMINK